MHKNNNDNNNFYTNSINSYYRNQMQKKLKIRQPNNNQHYRPTH